MLAGGFLLSSSFAMDCGDQARNTLSWSLIFGIGRSLFTTAELFFNEMNQGQLYLVDDEDGNPEFVFLSEESDSENEEDDSDLNEGVNGQEIEIIEVPEDLPGTEFPIDNRDVFNAFFARNGHNMRAFVFDPATTVRFFGDGRLYEIFEIIRNNNGVITFEAIEIGSNQKIKKTIDVQKLLLQKGECYFTLSIGKLEIDEKKMKFFLLILNGIKTLKAQGQTSLVIDLVNNLIELHDSIFLGIDKKIEELKEELEKAEAAMNAVKQMKFFEINAILKALPKLTQQEIKKYAEMLYDLVHGIDANRDKNSALYKKNLANIVARLRRSQQEVGLSNAKGSKSNKRSQNKKSIKDLQKAKKENLQVRRLFVTHVIERQILALENLKININIRFIQLIQNFLENKEESLEEAIGLVDFLSNQMIPDFINIFSIGSLPENFRVFFETAQVAFTQLEKEIRYLLEKPLLQENFQGELKIEEEYQEGETILDPNYRESSFENSNDESEIIVVKKKKNKTRGKADPSKARKKGKQEKQEEEKKETPEGSDVLSEADAVEFQVYALDALQGLSFEIYAWILEGARQADAPDVREEAFTLFGDRLAQLVEDFLVNERQWSDYAAAVFARNFLKDFVTSFHKIHGGSHAQRMPANYMVNRLGPIIWFGLVDADSRENLSQGRTAGFVTNYYVRLVKTSGAKL